MENNETKVIAKVINEAIAEVINNTNNIIGNFNEDSDTIFEKEMPTANEEVNHKEIEEMSIDNDTFVMDIPSLNDLDYAEVKFENVKALKNKLNKTLHTLIGENLTLDIAEHSLWNTYLEQSATNNVESSLQVAMYNNLRAKYDNLLNRYLEYKKAYKELEDLIYADDNALIEK